MGIHCFLGLKRERFGGAVTSCADELLELDCGGCAEIVELEFRPFCPFFAFVLESKCLLLCRFEYIFFLERDGDSAVYCK